MKYWNIVSVLFAVLICSSCNQSNKETKNILRINLGANIPSFDPRISGSTEAQIVIGMLFEGLMRLDRQGNPQPGIAERYEMSENNMSCTFHLRDVKWSNGEPLTAHDFANAWREILDPFFPSKHAFAFYLLKNGKAIQEGVLPKDQLGVHALDDRTLFIEFEYPAPFFIDLTANPIYSPVYLKGDSKELISNGPFILKSTVQNDHIRVVKNQKYWDAQSINIDEISISIIQDPNTAFMMYTQGMLDIIGNPMIALPLDEMEEMKKKNLLDTADTNRLFWLVFNTEQPPFNSAKIRKAFSYAINRKDIAENFMLMESPATSVLPKNLLLQTSPYFKDGDVETARKLLLEGLKELGMTKENLPKIRLNFSPRWHGKQLMQIIQQQWIKAFEIPVELNMTEGSIYASINIHSDFQIGYAAWDSWLNDPLYNLGHLKTKNSLNVSRWENPQYRELIELAENEKDIDQRREYFHQAEIFLMQEMPIVPLFFSCYRYLKKDDVEGICFSKGGQIDFKWTIKR